MDGKYFKVRCKKDFDLKKLKHSHTITIMQWLTPLYVQLKNKHEKFVLVVSPTCWPVVNIILNIN